MGEEQVPYSNANESTFVENFFPKDFEDGIFTISDTLSVLNSTITKVSPI